MKLITLGYGGRTLKEVADLCHEHEVGILVDVRDSTSSRNPEFKGHHIMGARFHELKVRYEWVKDLGNAERKTGGIRLNDAVTGLYILSELLDEHGTVAIMCVCRQYEKCHRLNIATHIQQDRPNVEVVHIA